MRTVTHTYHGFDQPDVLLTIDGTEHQGELRAWAVDEAGDWWAMCQYRTTPCSTLLG